MPRSVIRLPVKEVLLEIVATGQGSPPVVVLVAPRRATRLPLSHSRSSPPRSPRQHLGGPVEAVGEQDHGLLHGASRPDLRATPVVAKPMAPSVSATGHASGKARWPSARSASRIWWRSEALVWSRISGIGAPGLGQPSQDLAGERRHDVIAAHQASCQKPRNPLISHIPAIGRTRQPGGPHISTRLALRTCSVVKPQPPTCPAASYAAAAAAGPTPP